MYGKKLWLHGVLKCTQLCLGVMFPCCFFSTHPHQMKTLLKWEKLWLQMAKRVYLQDTSAHLLLLSWYWMQRDTPIQKWSEGLTPHNTPKDVDLRFIHSVIHLTWVTLTCRLSVQFTVWLKHVRLFQKNLLSTKKSPCWLNRFNSKHSHAGYFTVWD